MEHIKYANGTILKRKYEDFQEVRVIGHDDSYLWIKDASGVHYVSHKAIPIHFELISEPEPKDA